MLASIDRAAHRAVESRRCRKVAQALQDAHSGGAIGRASNAACRWGGSKRFFSFVNSMKIPSPRISIFRLL
jgi:hypothetical protein